jgi:hypothetical protein
MLTITARSTTCVDAYTVAVSRRRVKVLMVRQV